MADKVSDAPNMSNLGTNAIIRTVYDNEQRANRVMNLGSLVPEAFDYIALSYVSSGNGAGEIETVTYKTGGSGGTTVATLTIAYNADNEISSVTRT